MQCCREPGKTECHFLTDRYQCPGVLSSCVTFQHPGSSSWDLHKQQCLCCCTFPRCVPAPELCPVAQCAPAGSAGAGMKSILTVCAHQQPLDGTAVRSIVTHMGKTVILCCFFVEQLEMLDN